VNFVDKFLAKKPSDRPTARESVMLIPSFVKSAYNESLLKSLGSNDNKEESQKVQEVEHDFDIITKKETSPENKPGRKINTRSPVR
jgi:hypothetical protein